MDKQNFQNESNQNPPYDSHYINTLLRKKYSFTQYFHYTKMMNSLIQEDICQQFVQLHEYNFLDDDEEYLKRQYHEQEYDKKITLLSQYYRFHTNVPKWPEKSAHMIMDRHYTQMKNVDYKRIKKILKKQQNISISTQKSFSSFQSSFQGQQKKSKYSSMLPSEFHQKEQSVVLKEMCTKIGKSLKKIKHNFHNNIHSNLNLKKIDFNKESRKFQEYLQRVERKKKRKYGSMKINPIFMNVNAFKMMKKKVKLSQKTTQNQTLQRQERVKGTKSHIKKSRSHSKSVPKLKIQNMIESKNLKTINEIYRPTEGKSRSHSKNHSQSQSHTQSHRNILNVNIFNSQKIGKVRKSSNKKINTTSKTTRREESARKQSSKKQKPIKRVHSAKKLEIKQKGSDWLTQKKKNQVIDGILQKKLLSFHKKQLFS